MSDPIEDFRQNIRKLKADGDDGFEGLIAAVLSALTKRSFTLASAGSQRGMDGLSALDGGVILFEAKRYDDAVPKDKIYTKIFEIAADRASTAELYILAATSPISAQLITTLKDGARRLALTLVVLAWPESGLADLAALLAMTPDVSAKFISKHTSVSETELAGQLSVVRTHPQFQERSGELLTTLVQPSVAPAFALKDNFVWLSEAFSDRRRARSVFGQPLSPADASIPCAIDRTDLRALVARHVFAKPDGAVTAIVGADGNGKSWIFAQAWNHQAKPPLTVVIVPDDIGGSLSLEYCRDLLISKLLSQTGELPKSEARERWLRHFERWKASPDTVAPRLVVFVDGVNQRASVDWLRFMDAMSAVVAELSGRLVFSSRWLFYRDNLERKLVSGVVVIDVPEWTDSELEGLLREQRTSIAALDDDIVRSLRNPRIFGIAAALLKGKEITGFGELSVSRLLFEHILSGSAVEGAVVSPKQFAADICTHAEGIVQRLERQQRDGLNEFDMPALVTAGRDTRTISEQFVITSAGRFFEVLDENPNKYALKDEGLPLALGLALVRTAREAMRKRRSVAEALSNILDPIAALDRTGDILLGAILAAVLERAPKEIVTPLVHSFVMLQNPKLASYPEFRSLFGRDPAAFLGALEESALVSDVASSLSWLTDAANDLRGNEDFEAALAAAIHRWLNMYSLAPERMVLIPSNSEHAAERMKKLAERELQLSKIIASLSQVEHALLRDMLRQDRGDYSRLSLLAFQFLAGRPLDPFAESLRNWCFATSLNGGYDPHQSEFHDLLHFNLVDWGVTKDALREAANLLRQSDVSGTGQWALVYVLRVTGDSSDAAEAGRIVEELTRGHERSDGWRLVERYCATDPCDPLSEAPDNIERTAIDYGAINPAELCSSSSSTQDSRVFEMARPGLARFRPDAAVGALRAFADQAVTRAQPQFRHAIFLLARHAAGLEERIAKPYVEKARDIAKWALDTGEDKNNEAWVAAQYALGVAFPHMSGDAQFDALINHPKDRTVLLDLTQLFQPIEEIKLEFALAKALDKDDAVTQLRILTFAEYSRTPLTARSKEMALQLLVSEHDHVRLSVLALIRATADPILLAGLVKSDWSAASLDSAAQKLEVFHGSQSLVEAAGQGLIALRACLDRIALSAYADLAERLGAEAAMAIAHRLDIAIYKAAEFYVTGNLPDIEQVFQVRRWSVILEISEKRPQGEDPDERFCRRAESGDAWYERQRRNQEASKRFEQDLTRAGAQLITQSATVELIEAIDGVAPDIVESWCALFQKLENRALSNVYNIVSVVAAAISKRDAAVGRKLFERLTTNIPHVRVTFGRDRLGIDVVTVWGAAGVKEIKELLFARLDRVGNDHELATEILAAIKADRLDVLREYVVDRRSRSEPAHRARAAMVAGLSPAEPWAIETIDMLKEEHGFMQYVYQAARYAMERHQWSRHWAAQMRTATSPVDFWRHAVLLSKIVDGRFSEDELRDNSPNPLVERFGMSLGYEVRDRIRKWKDKRRSKLFGMSAPNGAFLPG